MPMLERTAASLEPCNIQRVLPSTSTANPFTSRRRLHTAFWQHGAADIDLSNVCQIISRGSLDPPESFPPAHSQSEPVIASTFLLDFLYPHGAATLLRKLAPTVLERYERPRNRLRSHGSRLYTSVATSSESPREASRVDYRSPQPSLSRLAISTSPELGHGSSLIGDDKSDNVSNRRTAPEKDVATSEKRERGIIKKLRQRLLLPDPTESDLEHVWDGYHQLNPDLRPSIRPDVIASLAHSKSLVWAARVVQLFAELNPLQWDSRLVSVAIHASLRLGKDSEAIHIFKQALRRQTLRGSITADGLDRLVLHTLRTSSWDVLFDIWRAVFSVSPAHEFKSVFLEEFASVPGIEAKLSTLYDLTSGADGQSELQDLHSNLRAKFLNPLLRALLVEFEPHQAFALVRIAGEPTLCEEFISLCITGKQSQLAAETYATYRTLPSVRIRVPIMRAMIKDVFYPNNAGGMETILRDWYERYEKLDIFGYQKFLAFYASRGDVQSVNRMWKEYVQHYPNVISNQSDTFTYLLHVHAIRGDIRQVRKTFDEIKDLHGTKPPTECWNILLNTYVKIHDYDGALKVFDDLCMSTEPDHYSFGTMMGMSGSRGDLDMTLDLYRLSRDKGIKPTMAILDGVVEAYCQNDAFALAENICLMTTRNRRVQGNYTPLWNTLLHHHALRRDLTTVNRLLDLMSQLDVPYDDKTFDSLLKALVFCRQAHHTLHLLQVAAKEHAFEPTYHHYILLMSAFIRTREPFRAIHTHNLLNKWGFPETSDRLLRVIEALGQYRHLPSNEANGKSVEHLNIALREFRRSLKEEKQDMAGLIEGTSPLKLSEQLQPASTSARTEQASLLIFLFSEMSDFATVQQIIEMWYSSAPPSEERIEMPLELLSAILYSNFCENKFDQVRETWTAIFERACKKATAPGPRAKPELLPRYQYLLVDPLKTMQRMYEAENNPDGLVDLVSTVTTAGFKLDNKNWNYYVQILARLKRWQDAFKVCEEVLMPRWTGWYMTRRKQRVKNRLPLDLRRIGSSPEYLRPMAHTLFVLAKEYKEMEQLAPWSQENSRVLSGINEHCPRTIMALKSMSRTGSEAEDAIFSQLTRDLGGKAKLNGSSPVDIDDSLQADKESPTTQKRRSFPRLSLNELSGNAWGNPPKGKKRRSPTKDDGLSADDQDFLSKGLRSSGSPPTKPKRTTQQYDDDEAWVSDNSDIAPGR